MRLVFYSRPWSADLHLALEDHWRRSDGPVTVRYITHHLQVVKQLERAGRKPVFLPAEVARLDVAEPLHELEAFEERHGDQMLPLTRYLMSERFFRKRARAWQLEQLARYARFFESLFEDFRPDLLLGESPDIMPAWLAYDLAPQYGCEPVGMVPSTLPADRLLMLRNHREVAGARELYETLRNQGLDEPHVRSARELQAIVAGKGTKIDYVSVPQYLPDVIRRMARTTSLAGLARRLDPREVLRGSLWQLRERAASNWFVQPDPILDRASLPLRGLRGRLGDRLYLKDAPPSAKYVFYPLHFQPEATTLIHGSYFENQLEVVRNLARSMPVGWQLVVKEHFYMLGRRKLSLYRALSRIPNVRLVPFSVPTNELIINAEAVAIIASTVGLEASLVGKPVVMFGDYPWDYAPTIHKVGALAELPMVIRRAAETPLDPDHPDVLAFAASWDAALPPGRYFSGGYDWLEPSNVEGIAGALEQAMAREGQRLRS